MAGNEINETELIEALEVLPVYDRENLQIRFAIRREGYELGVCFHYYEPSASIAAFVSDREVFRFEFWFERYEWDKASKKLVFYDCAIPSMPPIEDFGEATVELEMETLPCVRIL